MFYLSSKLFWMVVQPLSLALLLSLVSWLLIFFGKRRFGLGLLALGLLVTGLAGFTTIGALLIAPLEARFERPATLPEQVDTIIMLGGATSAVVSTARQISEITEAGDRLVETVWLAQRYPQARVVLTGGVAMTAQGAESEAATMERLLLAFGIAPERLVLEDKARNTDENAEFTKAALGDDPGTVILVTSAFHMPRSAGLFRKVGITPIYWPTDYRSVGNESFGVDLADPVSNLETTTVALKEWIGLLVYHWTGRTDDLFPDQASN